MRFKSIRRFTALGSILSTLMVDSGCAGRNYHPPTISTSKKTSSSVQNLEGEHKERGVETRIPEELTPEETELYTFFIQNRVLVSPEYRDALRYFSKDPATRQRLTSPAAKEILILSEKYETLETPESLAYLVQEDSISPGKKRDLLKEDATASFAALLHAVYQTDFRLKDLLEMQTNGTATLLNEPRVQATAKKIADGLPTPYDINNLVAFVSVNEGTHKEHNANTLLDTLGELSIPFNHRDLEHFLWAAKKEFREQKPDPLIYRGYINTLKSGSFRRLYSHMKKTTSLGFPADGKNNERLIAIMTLNARDGIRIVSDVGKNFDDEALYAAQNVLVCDKTFGKTYKGRMTKERLLYAAENCEITKTRP